jgi:UDP-N-acetylmuramate dehydrogenase
MHVAEWQRERLKQHASIAKYTAARLGGAADWLYVTKPDDPIESLAQLVSLAWAERMPVRVMGGGANILVADKGVRGLVIVNHIAQIEMGHWHDGRNVSVTSGTGLLALARFCAAQGLAGMEWAVGVPGTIGGAIVNNAGAHGADMAQSIAEVVVLEADRGPQLYTRADLEYAYRTSALKHRADKRFLVLLANLILQPDDPAAIQSRMEHNNTYRKTTQPPGASLGSIFKNPPGDYAGRLIEACGLKGYAIGNVQVSPLHANFFINTGDATASDYYALICYVQSEVQRQTGIELELEIELVGEW